MEEAKELESSVRGHFLHPHHCLAKTHKDTGFTCDACRTPGRGTRYRCDPCDFDLHIYWAYCPLTILSPLHPQHKLTLIRKLCGVCAKFVREHVFYRCTTCEIDFHPSCIASKSDHPNRLSSPLHPQHELARAAHSCNDCREHMKGVFYRCKDCDFDLLPLCHQRTMTTSTINTSHRPGTSSLYFFMHPEHDLTFVERIRSSPDSGAEELRGRWCAVCGVPAEKNSYICSPCSFRVHRECASIRPTVRDEAHPPHVLHYLRSRASPCAICKESCVLWRYHCSACRVHIHRHCLKGPAAATPQEA